MPLQFSVDVRNARLDAIETRIGTSAVLKICVGAVPANCAASDTSQVLATFNLPVDWMTAASDGVKQLAGSWQDTSADSSGIAGHFRIYDSGGTTCHVQGTVSMVAGTSDLTLDNTNIAVGQNVTITGFTLTDGNA